MTAEQTGVGAADTDRGGQPAQPADAVADHRPAPPPLCPPCAAADAAWRDARPAQGGIRIHTVVQSARDVIDARTRRVEEHYELVRWQREFNARLCREGKHAEPRS